MHAENKMGMEHVLVSVAGPPPLVVSITETADVIEVAPIVASESAEVENGVDEATVIVD